MRERWRRRRKFQKEGKTDGDGWRRNDMRDGNEPTRPSPAEPTISTRPPPTSKATPPVHHTQLPACSTVRAECAQCREMGGRRHEGRPPIGLRASASC